MKYFILQYKSDESNTYIKRIEYDPEKESALFSGEPLSQQIEIVLYKEEKESIDTDLLGGAIFLPVVSEKLNEIIQKQAPWQTEAHPVKLYSIPLKMEKRNYLFLNILTIKNALDWKTAVYKARSKDEQGNFSTWDSSNIPEPFPNKIALKGIYSLILDPGKLEGINIFRLRGREDLIFVSEILKQEIEERGVTGVKFLPIEEYKHEPLI